MAITTVPNLGPDPFTVNASVLNGKVDPLVTDYNGNIDNTNIAAAAAIANSKLNLATIAQNVTLAGANTLSGTNTLSGVTTMSSKIFKLAKGADVASTAGTITLGDDGNYFDITGTAAITSITAKAAGTMVTLQFDSTASLVDGSNLKLAGNFSGAAESQITLISDGTNWFEVCRQPSSTTLVAASQAEMEAASSTTVYATPGRTGFHPGVAKGWVNFNGTSTPTVVTSYNVDSSITDNGTGDYTISWTTDFSSAGYVVVGSGYASGVYITMRGTATGTGLAAGTFRSNWTDAATTLTDPTVVTIIAFGDQ